MQVPFLKKYLLNLQHIENDKHVTNSFLDSNANSEENNYRGERTCKGLRYQKFLAEQIRHIGPSGQNNKRKKSTTSYR